MAAGLVPDHVHLLEIGVGAGAGDFLTFAKDRGTPPIGPDARRFANHRNPGSNLIRTCQNRLKAGKGFLSSLVRAMDALPAPAGTQTP